MYPAGYLHKKDTELLGEKGLFYDYMLAANGLFLRSESPFIRATIRIADVVIRGLAPLQENFELVQGKVPHIMSALAQDILIAVSGREAYLAITWSYEEKRYSLAMPDQAGYGANVQYDTVPNTVVEMHSHPCGAFFSSTDDRDEQGFKVYLVLGHDKDLQLEYVARVGLYGYFKELRWEDIFGL